MSQLVTLSKYLEIHGSRTSKITAVRKLKKESHIRQFLFSLKSQLCKKYIKDCKCYHSKPHQIFYVS